MCGIKEVNERHQSEWLGYSYRPKKATMNSTEIENSKALIYSETLILELVPPMSGICDWRWWARVPLVAEGNYSSGEYGDRTRAPPSDLHADHAPHALHLEMKLDDRASCLQHCHPVPSTRLG